MTEQQQAPAPAPRPALDEIGAALSAFQAEMPTVAKSHTATVKSDKGSYSYTYAGLADVCEAAMPLLAKHGLSFVTMPSQNVLTGLLLHKSGQSLTASLPITGSTPQQIGSSLTYMRRYLLGCMTGVVTDDDDDGRIAQSQPRAKKAAKPAPRPEFPPAAAPPPPPPPAKADPDEPMRDKTRKQMFALFSERGIHDEVQQRAGMGAVIGREIASRGELSEDEALAVIRSLRGADK